MVRRVLQFIAVVILATIPLALAVTPARADDISDFLGQVNALRADHGLPALTTSVTLTSDAQAWSQQMASSGVFEDDPNLAAQVGGGWSRLGENTAYGTYFDSLFNALVHSPPHLANMLGSYSLTGIGAGVVTTGWDVADRDLRDPQRRQVDSDPGDHGPDHPPGRRLRPKRPPPPAVPSGSRPAPPRCGHDGDDHGPGAGHDRRPDHRRRPRPRRRPPRAVSAVDHRFRHLVRGAVGRGRRPRRSPLRAPAAAVVLSGHDTPGVVVPDWALWISVAAIAMIAGGGWLAGRVQRRR